jgi:hypothetical protein
VEEYQRRLVSAAANPKQADRTLLVAQLRKLRQGVGRLIDSYAEGIIEKDDFEPRIARLKERIAVLETQERELEAEASLERQLQLIVGRLEDFRRTMTDNLDQADWTTQRELIRTLVARVGIDRDDVQIVFRIDPRSTDPDPGHTVLQDCRRGEHPTLRRTAQCGVIPPLFQIPSLEQVRDQPKKAVVSDALAQDGKQDVVVQPVETLGDVAFDEPRRGLPRVVDVPQRRVTAAAGPETVGGGTELRLVIRLQKGAHHFLQQFVRPGGNP